MSVFRFVGALIAIANLFAAITLLKRGNVADALLLLFVSAWVATTLIKLK